MVGSRRDRRRRHRRRHLPVRAPPARRIDAGRPRRDRGRVGVGRLRRGCGLRARSDRRGVRRAGAAALRRLRRRRVRGRADLRRHPRRLRREGLARRPSPSSARSPPTSRPAGRSRWPPSSSTPTRPGSGAGSSYAPAGAIRHTGLGARRRRGPRRRDGAAGRRAQRDPDLRPRRRAPRRGDARLRVGVRAEAADAGLRRHRLRGRGGAGRRLPRLPRHGLRRPAGVRDAAAASRRPTRSSSTGRTDTSTPRPRRAGSTRARSSRC